MVQASSELRSPRWRGWLALEVIVGFLPLAVILILGVLMSPVWVGMLIAPIFDAEIRGAMGLLEVAITFGSLLLVVVGFLGLIGLVRVVRSIVTPSVPMVRPRQTRIYAIAGTCVIAILVVVYSTFGYHVVAALGVPALFVSAHVMYLARHTLFSHAPLLPPNTSLERTREG